MPVTAALALAPDPEWLGLCAPLVRLCGAVSITPETTWRGPNRAPNDYARAFGSLADEAGAFVIGHGVGLSLASEDPGARREAWLATLARDHAARPFAWYTDHLGLTVANGEDLQLPLPVPHSTMAAARIRAGLDALSEALDGIPVGVENSAWYFHPSDPLSEPSFIEDCLGDRHHLLLDLHNLYTSSTNLGFDPERWLARLPLDRVIEIHLSGGGEAPPSWTGGRRIRLDSHDSDVPDEVWSLFDAVHGECPNLRAVTLERIEGSVAPGDVPRLRDSLLRIRESVS
jgi:uncharacterized protein (UPF0276 family)